MAKKRLLVFGGTFDPVHNGHISILKNAIEKVKPDKTLVIPSYIPPHKLDNCTSVQVRLQMCEVFLAINSTIEIDPIEITRQGKSYTVDTLRQLKKKYPDHHIYLLVGSDMLLYLQKWREYEKIMRMVTFVCQIRQNSDKKNVSDFRWFLHKNHSKIVFCRNEILCVSSTEIRAKVLQNQSIDDMVPKSVCDIIKNKSLYKR